MGTTTTLRPSGTSSGSGWTPSAGTLHGVTSDNSDATYATWGGSGPAMVLSTPADAPPAGERRHAVRLRVRGEDGDARWAVRLNSGVLTANAAASFDTSLSTVSGSWGFGAPATGSTVLYAYVTGQSSGVKINELYLDVDSRDAPTMTPQVLDGSGASTVLVADTAQPIIRAASIDLDDLNARQYRYWVTLNGATVWDTGITSGPAVNRQTTALDNGSYIANMIVWSTLGANTEYPSDQESLAFTVAVGTVDRPANPTVTPEADSPFYVVEACAPDVADLDDSVGYIEVQRVDCPVGGYLISPGTSGAYVSSPDPAQVSGNLEIIVKAQRDDDWRPAANQNLVAHYDTGSNQRGWRLYLDADGDGDPAIIGRPIFGWSDNGIVNYAWRADDRIPIDPYGIVRLRVTFDPILDEITFWSRETDEGEWVAFSTDADGVATSIFASSAPYTIGAVLVAGVASERFEGNIYSVEVRDGTTTVLSPDFTNHLDGTREFDDTQGNTWTVNGSAAVYSPTSVTTLAILGPLATDECAEWVDYTIPRTGVGVTCTHTPAQCCSYYRARTVGRIDGELRISDWSDVAEDGLPEDLIVMWPSTAASIPAGWSRVSALDGLYLKGIPDAVTSPGTAGGSATHSHTVASHAHSTAHGHGHTGATSAGSGAVSSSNGAVGTTAIATTHTHTRNNFDTATFDSGGTTATVTSVSNDVERLEVIFIEPDGTPTGIPNGAASFFPDIAPSGWVTYTDASDRFLKGVIGASGGATIASALDSHVHAMGAHTHTGVSHHHGTTTTSSAVSNLSLFAGPNAVLWTTAHSHVITSVSSTSGALASGGAADTGASGSSMLPPYRNLRVRQNTSGVPDLPVGLICPWRGALSTIPAHWQLCDGTNGTPNMLGVYPRAATASIDTTGGADPTHAHTNATHTHTAATHTHTETIASAGAATANTSATVTVSVSTGTHTHTGGATDASGLIVTAAASGTPASTDADLPHEEVAFIQLMEEFGPPEDPTSFCFTWTDDQHLIRTLGPDGPLWAPILGKFEWSVDRPFTAATGINGGRFVTSASPGGRDMSMTAAVESEEDLTQLREVLARPLVLISPSDATEVWAAPVTESVQVVKVGRIRRVTATFIGTGSQPPPQLADVGV
jgi:hypothetical protein